MGDRWSYPHQASAATYMWMPLQVEGTKISIPEYWQAWDIQTLRPVDILKEGKILSSEKITLPTDWKRKNGQIISDRRGSKMEFKFKGTHAALVGEANPHSGYAKISIVNHKRIRYTHPWWIFTANILKQPYVSSPPVCQKTDTPSVWK